MKYIVFVGDKSDGQGEREFIVIFDRSIDHDIQFESLHMLRNNSGTNWERCWVDPQPVSAGFVSPELQCYGRSETLNVDSRPKIDTELLKRKLRAVS